MALPAKMDAMIGDQALWSAAGLYKKIHTVLYPNALTIVPRHDGRNYTFGLIDYLGLLVTQHQI